MLKIAGEGRGKGWSRVTLSGEGSVFDTLFQKRNYTVSQKKGPNFETV